MGILGCWAHLCHNQVSSTSPQFVFTCVNPHLSPHTSLNSHMIKVYAIFLKPVFFWDTLYLLKRKEFLEFMNIQGWKRLFSTQQWIPTDLERSNLERRWTIKQRGGFIFFKYCYIYKNYSGWNIFWVICTTW